MNKVMLIGRLGEDPVRRFIPDGTLVVTVSLATSRRYKDKSTGEKKQHTEWHRVEFWPPLAEVVAEYCVKGSQIYVEGELRTRAFEKDGEKRYSTVVKGNELELLGSKPAGHAPAAEGSAPAGYAAADAGGDNWEEDDIPF
jgi:single-strand DNA-binding protein